MPLPDLITLDLETPDAESPTAAAVSDAPAAAPVPAGPLPLAVLTHRERSEDANALGTTSTEDLTAERNVGRAPTGYPARPTSADRQPIALTEVNSGNPEADPSTDNAVIPSGSPADPAPAPVYVHKARLQDARNIFDLVNSLSHDGTLLRRSYAEICENVRDFTVAEQLDPTDPTAEPHFLGCGALHLYGPHLAEVRSIVLYPEARGQGAGAALLRALLAEAEEHGVTSTCLFTRLPDFFEHFGFRTAERSDMPDKMYKDCQTCPRLYACDEVAMVKGPLPGTAVLGPLQVKQPQLVQVQMLPSGSPHDRR